MATDLERLTVSLEANVKKFEREMARARGVAVKAMKDVEDRATDVEKSLGRAFGRLGGVTAKAFAAIGAGLSLNELRQAADEYTRIVNTLKVAGVGSGDLPVVFDKLFASAQRNAVPLESLAQLYGRVSQAQTTLKASSQELLGLTDIVAQSLRVSGTSASEASGALLQLGQSLSGGKVQAEEYNSLLDGMYPLLQAAAAGLKEAGGDVAKLTALVKDGEVSSEAFFRAIQAGAPILGEKLAGAALTTDQAMQRLRNEFVRAVGEFDKATGVSAALARGLDGVAGSLGGIGRAATDAVVGVQTLIGKLAELAAANAGAQRAQALSYQDELAQRRRQAIDMSVANAGGRTAVAGENDAARRRAIATMRAGEIDFANRLTTTALPPVRPAGAGAGVKPVSLADFKVPGEEKGGGGGGSKARLDAYERELQALRKRTTELDLEAKMVGKGTLEREKSRAALDLENAAKKAGIPITQEMRRVIDEAATGYANAKVKVEDVTKALEATQEAQRFLSEALVDGLEDIIFSGEKVGDVMKNVAKQIAKAALQAALLGNGPLAGIFGSKGSGGNLGGLAGMIFGGARAAGGPVSSGRAYMVGEKGPEMFVPRQSGGIVPNHALRGRGGGAPVSVSVAIDARGATPDAVAMLRGELRGLEARLPGVIMRTQAEAVRRGAR